MDCETVECLQWETELLNARADMGMVAAFAFLAMLMIPVLGIVAFEIRSAITKRRT